MSGMRPVCGLYQTSPLSTGPCANSTWPHAMCWDQSPHCLHLAPMQQDRVPWLLLPGQARTKGHGCWAPHGEPWRPDDTALRPGSGPQAGGWISLTNSFCLPTRSITPLHSKSPLKSWDFLSHKGIRFLFSFRWIIEFSSSVVPVSYPLHCRRLLK